MCGSSWDPLLFKVLINYNTSLRLMSWIVERLLYESNKVGRVKIAFKEIESLPTQL
jgi:hypothetical protein